MTELVDRQALQHWSPVPGQRLSQCMERGVVRAADAAGEQRLLVSSGAGPDALLWAQHAGPVLDEHVVAAADLQAWLTHWSARTSTLDATDAETGRAPGGGAQVAEALSLRHLDLATSPVVRLVNAMLFDALRAGASDVHVESSRSGLVIKYRIDGVLRTMADMPGTLRAEQVVSRIKVMAELDIAERRVPQDGRLQVTLEDRPVDVRVSVMPSIHGEDAVLRILDRQHLAKQLEDLTLEALGFEAIQIAAIEALARRPHGMLLVTGPTGSGKTTTLYATINRTTNSSEKVVTIEDPVEYQLPGVLQIPVNEAKGLTFARGLRSILRHDPDKILVGEIRDSETAQIAVQAALTGHLVFTTVHANDVFDVLGRFRQFGIDSYSLMSALTGVLSQRLLRRVCGICAMRSSGDDVPRMVAVGCDACGGAGYKGRFALGELVTFGPRLKGLISAGADYETLRTAVLEQGAAGLRKRAVAAVEKGLTTMEEVERVTADT